MRLPAVVIAAGLLAAAPQTARAQTTTPRATVPSTAQAMVKGLQGDKGPPGDKGPMGDKGPPGDKGPAGGPTAVAGYEIATMQMGTSTAVSGTWLAVCPTGKKPVGGGFMPSARSTTILSGMYPSGNQWKVAITNQNPGQPMEGVLFAICVLAP